jgi:hypothetical protein
MASINLNNLQNIGKNTEKYTYTDIYLDLAEDITTVSNFTNTIGSGRDMKVAYDLNAIRNSIVNLFSTIPGQRYLLPEYGSDLRKYVFEQITDITGRQIGREINRAIVNWEPRVRIISLNIIGYEDRNEYEITLILEVPFLKQRFNLTGILNKEGYVTA